MVPREHGGIGVDSLTYAVILSRVAKGWVVAAAADFTFATGNMLLTDGGRWLF